MDNGIDNNEAVLRYAIDLCVDSRIAALFRYEVLRAGFLEWIAQYLGIKRIAIVVGFYHETPQITCFIPCIKDLFGFHCTAPQSGSSCCPVIGRENIYRKAAKCQLPELCPLAA